MMISKIFLVAVWDSMHDFIITDDVSISQLQGNSCKSESVDVKQSSHPQFLQNHPHLAAISDRNEIVQVKNFLMRFSPRNEIKLVKIRITHIGVRTEGKTRVLESNRWRRRIPREWISGLNALSAPLSRTHVYKENPVDHLDALVDDPR